MMRPWTAFAVAAAATSSLLACERLGAPALSARERAPCLSLPERCAGESGVFPVSGYSPRLPGHELAPIAARLADADVVGLGEAAHGSAGFIGMKVRLSRQLIEHHGFRVVAWESERVRTRKLDAYVQTCTGSPREAVRQLHEYWADEQTRDFAVWLCEWNRTHPKDRVHVYGFDVQDPAADRAELRQLLSRTQEVPGSRRKRKTWSPLANHLSALTLCERGHDDLCRVALRDFRHALAEQARRTHAMEPTSWMGAARIALTSYSAWQARATIADEARAFEARALGMASVFLQLRRRYFPHQKSILWAHNIHVVKQHQNVRWTWLGTPIETLGTQLERRLGAGYRAVALVGWEVSIERGKESGPANPSPAPDSVEALLHEIGQPGLFIDLRDPNAGVAIPAYERFQLGAPGAEILAPADHYDGILYLERSPRAKLL